MNLYYTGVLIPPGIQVNAHKSTGGYLSTSKVPSGSMENFFSEISQYTIEKDLKEIIGVVLKNETGSALTGVSLWVELPVDSYVKIEIALVNLTTDAEGYWMMEKVANRRALPYYATFVEANGEVDAIGLPDLSIDGMIGIWFRRSLDQTKVAELFTNEKIIARFKGEENALLKEEQIHLKMDWTVES